MTNVAKVASKLRLALQQIDSLPANAGVSPEQLIYVRENLARYMKQLDQEPDSIQLDDLNHVGRLVVEYWPITLTAGESVIAAEQELRKFVEQKRT